MKNFITVVMLVLVSSSVVFASDSLATVCLSGKTGQDLVWKMTARDFQPGVRESEFALGKKVSKEITISGDYLQNSKDQEYLGLAVNASKPFGKLSASLNGYYWLAVKDATNKVKVTGCTNYSVSKNVYVGYGFLYSKSNGAKSYFEAGPQIGVKFNQYCLNLQAVHSSKDRNVVETTLSVAF